MKTKGLYKYVLLLADNAMILGHRLSELCGHGPSLETDMAITNIALDLFGQTRAYLQYAAKLSGGDATEDTIAFLRYEWEYYNCILVEQPNTDFGHVMVRQFFFDAFHKLQLEQLVHSEDSTLSAMADKALKEVRYHVKFSGEWVKRMGDGTNESHQKMQIAIDTLYSFTHELCWESETEKKIKEMGIGADLENVKIAYNKILSEVLTEATLEIPDSTGWKNQGKNGIHTEHMGYILSNFQYMQRAYPNMQW